MAQPGCEPNQCKNDRRLYAGLTMPDVRGNGPSQISRYQEQSKEAGPGISEQKCADYFQYGNKGQPASGKSDERHLFCNLRHRYELGYGTTHEKKAEKVSEKAAGTKARA